MRPRLNRIPNPLPGGPNDDSEAEPVVVKCALCDRLIDDGKSDPPVTIMRCPNCGPVCASCVRIVAVARSVFHPLETIPTRCCGCGAEVTREETQ